MDWRDVDGQPGASCAGLGMLFGWSSGLCGQPWKGLGTHESGLGSAVLSEGGL